MYSAIIVLTDVKILKYLVKLDIPDLALKFAPGLLLRNVNVNEPLTISALLPKASNPDIVDFTASVVYEFETRGYKKFNYITLKT
jgi:hypothetical protein